MARFKKLDVPHQWKDEFTKYPHGHSIFEAISKWVDLVNRMITNINVWNEYLGGFTSTFGEVPQQMAELIQEMSDLINSVNSDLTTIADDLTGLADEVTGLADEVTGLGNSLLSHLTDYATQADVIIKNEVINGDFSAGLLGWATTETGLPSISIEDGTLKVVPTYNQAGGATYLLTNVSANQKIYVSALIKTNGVGQVACLDRDGATTGIDVTSSEFVRSSVMATATSLEEPRMRVYIRCSNLEPVYADDVIAINLTTTFGAGNEPTKEEMDTFISLVPNGWWDGELKPSQKLLLNWQLKMIRQTKTQ